MSGQAHAVHTAIYTALSAALGCPVYDAVPQDAALPYVVIDASQTIAADFLADQHDERYFYLSVWSDYQGQKEVNEINELIRSTLHLQRLTIAVGRVVQCFVVRAESQRDRDGRTYMGAVTVRILTSR